MTSKCIGGHPELVEGRTVGNGALNPLYGSTELTMTLLWVHKNPVLSVVLSDSVTTDWQIKKSL